MFTNVYVNSIIIFMFTVIDRDKSLILRFLPIFNKFYGWYVWMVNFMVRFLPVGSFHINRAMEMECGSCFGRLVRCACGGLAGLASGRWHGSRTSAPRRPPNSFRVLTGCTIITFPNHLYNKRIKFFCYLVSCPIADVLLFLRTEIERDKIP